MNVVYFTEIWVDNIGEEMDCLLGMDFMVSASVRLSTTDGNVILPDEERIPLVSTPERRQYDLDVPITTQDVQTLYPGYSLTVPISFDQQDPNIMVL